MKLSARYLITGTIPYNKIDTATKMSAKLLEQLPFLALFPAIDENENIYAAAFQNIEGIKITGKTSAIVKTTSNNFMNAAQKIESAFYSDSPNAYTDYAINNVFEEKFLQIIKKFKSQNACFSLLGPFTILQMLENKTDMGTIPAISDKTCRKLVAQLVCLRALDKINKIKEFCQTTIPIVVLEEPYLSHISNTVRENEEISTEIITNMFSKVIEKLKNAGAIVCVKCMDKCNWQIPIKAGVDIITFDAYNNPNNLCIMPETITAFLERGGKINWAIVPTISESLVKSLNLDYLYSRLKGTIDGLVLAGIPAKLAYNSALVSMQGNSDHLPIIFCEKAIILTTQLAKKIPVIS